MRVLVLGAGGFIGSHIVAALVRRHGARSVIAGMRRASASAGWSDVEQRIVDAENEASVKTGATGATHIINSVMGSDRAIVESARNVAKLVENGAIDGAVHLSSIAVHGVRDGMVGEDDPLGPPADSYAAAKIEAERIFSDGAGAKGVILRPGLVYGPGSALWTLRIGRLVASGRLGFLGAAGEGTCNLVHVDDVADAAVAACEVETARRAFALVATPAPSWNGYFADMARAMDVPLKPQSPLRFGLERLLAYPLTMAQRIGIDAPEAITPGLARLFDSRMAFESSAVGSLLPGWRDYAQHVQESTDWFAKQRPPSRPR